MKSRFAAICLIACLSVVGCAATPQLSSWRPWYRVFDGHGITPKPGGTVRVIVKGTTEPLLGDESLFQAQLKERVSDLLSRRGYQLSDSAARWECTLIYRTSAETALRMSSSTYYSSRSSSWLASATALGLGWGQGVRYASGLSAATTTRTGASSSISVQEQEGFAHTIAIEFHDVRGAEAWKGEARWKSNRLELSNGLATALQMIVSQLPSQAATAPQARQVKSTHAAIYYSAVCDGEMYSCPALPNNIWFPNAYNGKVPDQIKDRDALAGYVDLVRTAEYSLPTGSKAKPWSRALLGGRYRIGDATETIPLLIELRGTRTGYEVQRAWRATDAEFTNFESRISKWRDQLRSYYDVYVP